VRSHSQRWLHSVLFAVLCPALTGCSTDRTGPAQGEGAGFDVVHRCGTCEIASTTPSELGPTQLEGFVSASRLVAFPNTGTLRLAWAPTDTRGTIGIYDHASGRTGSIGRLGAGPG
jgi:hypothetical protein